MKFNFTMDYHSKILWYFFAFALGCAVYFGVSFEPNFWILLGASIICGLCFYKRRWAFLGIVLFAVLGMGVSSARTHLVKTQMLEQPLWQQTISGFVDDIVVLQDKQVITLDRVWGKRKQTPSKVRLTLYDVEPEISTGDWVKVKAHLFPAGNLFAQRMFFQGIGARGKILKVIEIRHGDPSVIASVRSKIISRIKDILSSSSAQVAIPLTTGEQRVVSKETYDVYRKAGIAHVLSVSGFHMALLAGFIFFFIRGFLCLIPWIALRVNPKKIAAVIALIITFCYLLLSGIQIPALRSFLMIGVVLLAILLERRAFSLYTLLLVAFGLLCFHPEWIVSISFQLSFVAMVILVSLFEQVSQSLHNHKILHWVWAFIGANVLIELLLMPYVVYHFNQINLYGVLGNLAVGVIFSFCVMPLLFVACLLMPFGWDVGLFKITGWFLDTIFTICNWIGNLPFADIIVPSFHGVGLWIITLGIGILCLSKTSKRFIGLAVICCGFIVGYMFADRADILVADAGKTIVARGSDGKIYTNQPDENNWNRKRWLRTNGVQQAELVKDSVVVNNRKIALSLNGCSESEFAILPSKKIACENVKVFYPNRYVAYEIQVGQEILVRQEGANMMNRLWFQQRSEK